MTDLTPNDLSHMSDEDFNALCPQGHHAPGAEPLSPAAQEVDNAIADIEAQIEFTDLASGFNAYRSAVAAAALRAAAIYCKRDAVVLMAIADELGLP